VLIPVGRFVWGARRIAAFSLCLGLAAAVLAWRAGVSALAGAVWASAWLVTLLLALWVLPREVLSPGALHWDGEHWWFGPEGGALAPVQVRPMWDFGWALLLRVTQEPPARALSRYAWLQASRMPGRWHGLRCAVFSKDIL
jgi:hypothetical protein